MWYKLSPQLLVASYHFIQHFVLIDSYCLVIDSILFQ